MIDINPILESFYPAFSHNKKICSIICDYDFRMKTINLYTKPLIIRKIGGLSEEATNSDHSIVTRLVLTLENGSQTTSLISTNESFDHVRSETRTCVERRSIQLGLNEVKYLANALRTSKTLTEIDLCYNDLGSERVEHIVNSLKSIPVNNTLRILNITMNKIGDGGIQHISDFLQNSTTLTHLYLHPNGITEPGAQLLTLALKSNK
ncbi:unnamed protein product, partial [Rotaria magnacalcarata]